MLVSDWRHLNSDFEPLWERYKWVFLVCFLGILCDGLSTAYFMRNLGIDKEIHIVFRASANIFGPILGPLFGACWKMASCGIAVVLCKRFTVYILTAVTVISFWAAWYNIWGIKIYFSG